MTIQYCKTVTETVRMKKGIMTIWILLIAFSSHSQFKTRGGIPVSISVSRVVSYKIQNIDLGTTIQPTFTVCQMNGANKAMVLVEEGEVKDDEYSINGQYLRYTTRSNGLEASVEVQLMKLFGAGAGFQYNFKARERMKLYAKMYLYLSEKHGKFDLLPAIQIGGRQLYTGTNTSTHFYFGPEIDFDIRICSESTFYFSITAGADYYWNKEEFTIEDAAPEVPKIYEVVPRNENIILYGSLGLKYRIQSY